LPFNTALLTNETHESVVNKSSNEDPKLKRAFSTESSSTFLFDKKAHIFLYAERNNTVPFKIKRTEISRICMSPILHLKSSRWLLLKAM
jgi:hypothetical protein